MVCAFIFFSSVLIYAVFVIVNYVDRPEVQQFSLIPTESIYIPIHSISIKCISPS
jgi:hypothetical protein